MADESKINAAMARYPFMDFEHEPMRDGLFLIEFDVANIIYNNDAYRDYLSFRAQDVTVPGYSIATATDQFLNQQTSYAVGLNTQGSGLNFTINFVESYSPVNVMKLFADWRKLIENLDDFTMNFNRFYVTDFKVTILNLDRTVNKTYMFYDVYPTKIPTVTQFTYTTAPSLVTLSVSFNARMFKPL